MTQARLPDGTVLNFPDGTPTDVIQSAVKRQLGLPDTPVPILDAVTPLEESRSSTPSETFVAPEQELTAARLEANEILGLDPEIVERATILPFGKTALGETVFAVPEIALDVARAIILPGQVLRGTPVTEREITEAALAGGGPATKGLLAGKAVTKAGRLTAQQIADAPTSLDLTKASGKKFTAARQSGASLSADDFVGFLAGAERDIVDEGVDALLHPKLTGVFNVLTKKIGQAMDATDLQKIRRIIGIATESRQPDEARLARILRDNFDDFIENLPGTPEWIKARKLYIQARKAETVERAINKAGKAASGLENGLRVEFRKLLNNERKMRNFTKEEKTAMQAVVDGDFTTNTLKKIGRLGFGRGVQAQSLGTLGGIGLGGVVAGPVGGVIVPIAGSLAQKGAERKTLEAANILRALIGGVRAEPVVSLTDPALAVRTATGLAAVESGR